jgi:hypothetical protein
VGPISVTGLVVTEGVVKITHPGIKSKRVLMRINMYKSILLFIIKN